MQLYRHKYINKNLPLLKTTPMFDWTQEVWFSIISLFSVFIVSFLEKLTLFTLTWSRLSGTSTDVCMKLGLERPLWIDKSDTESVVSVGCSTMSDEGVGGDIETSVIFFFGLESNVFKRVRSSSSLDISEFVVNEERFGAERIYGNSFDDSVYVEDFKIEPSCVLTLKYIEGIVVL